MTEDDARHLLLVRAIESEDWDAHLLTREDRQRADAAGQDARSAGSRDTDDAFLAGRARFAAGRLATRHPAIEQVVLHARWPAWIGWAAPLAAFSATPGLFGTAKDVTLDPSTRERLLVSGARFTSCRKIRPERTGLMAADELAGSENFTAECPDWSKEDAP